MEFTLTSTAELSGAGAAQKPAKCPVMCGQEANAVHPHGGILSLQRRKSWHTVQQGEPGALLNGREPGDLPNSFSCSVPALMKPGVRTGGARDASQSVSIEGQWVELGPAFLELSVQLPPEGAQGLTFLTVVATMWGCPKQTDVPISGCTAGFQRREVGKRGHSPVLQGLQHPPWLDSSQEWSCRGPASLGLEGRRLQVEAAESKRH